MNPITALVLLAAAAASAEAVIDFTTSQLIDENDIKNSPNGVQISCSKGCTVYATKMTVASVAVFEGDVQKFTLKDKYVKEDGYLRGTSMAASTNYFLKKIPESDITEPVKVYVLAEAVGAGLVTDFDSTSSDFDLKPPGKNAIVTLLSSVATGVTFSSFKGTVAPKIYSCGFDKIRSCSALYTAISAENAAKSKIAIVSALTTINFGSTDVNNQCHVSTTVDYKNSASIGQSFIVMSPGYTGCASVLHNYNDVPVTTYEFKAGSENSRADIRFGDIYVAEGHEITVKATGQKDQKVTGTHEQSFSFASTYLEISVSWDKQDKQNEYFFAQIDFSNGISRQFGITTVATLLVKMCLDV